MESGGACTYGRYILRVLQRALKTFCTSAVDRGPWSVCKRELASWDMGGILGTRYPEDTTGILKTLVSQDAGGILRIPRYPQDTIGVLGIRGVLRTPAVSWGCHWCPGDATGILRIPAC